MSGENRGAMPQCLRELLDAVSQRRRAQLQSGFRYTPTNVREALDALTRLHLTETPEIGSVRDAMIAGRDYRVPVRVYHPRPQTALPVAVFIHGGGHVAGSVSLYDPLARKLALAAERILISVDYRLAPECPYPAALKDVLAAAKGSFRLLEELGVAYEPRLALIGDSGGGALSATVAHHSQYDPGLNIDNQILIYPSLDYTLSLPSTVELGEGFLLERERIIWLFDCYFQNAENRRDCSPLFMPITPEYPRTLVMTAEYCPLRDEGIAYAERLLGAGIPCEHEDHGGMLHAFLNLEDLVPGECEAFYQSLRRFLSGTPVSQVPRSRHWWD